MSRETSEAEIGISVTGVAGQGVRKIQDADAGQRWIDYFARRFKECLDRLALMYGFATERR